MQTDELFYELFALAPQGIIELLQLELTAHYRFRSLTLKSTEKRIDGIFEPIDGDGPILIVEIQGYNDPKVYWRALREVATYFEQTEARPPFILVILFLNEEHAPTHCPIQFELPSQLMCISLDDCLEAIRDSQGALNVLKPLVVPNLETLKQEVGGWWEQLQSLDIDEGSRARLSGLLSS